MNSPDATTLQLLKRTERGPKNPVDIGLARSAESRTVSERTPNGHRDISPRRSRPCAAPGTPPPSMRDVHKTVRLITTTT